jgi:hypothetical protein
MNVLRTIQRGEDEGWVRLLLRRGPHRGRVVPAYPPRFPLPFKPRRPLERCYLYLVYKGQVFGYGVVSRVARHPGTRVGTRQQSVRPGHDIHIAGPLKAFPFALPCRGFTGLRYTTKALHRLTRGAAGRVVRSLGLEIR